MKSQVRSLVRKAYGKLGLLHEMVSYIVKAKEKFLRKLKVLFQ